MYLPACSGACWIGGPCSVVLNEDRPAAMACSQRETKGEGLRRLVNTELGAMIPSGMGMVKPHRANRIFITSLVTPPNVCNSNGRSRVGLIWISLSKLSTDIAQFLLQNSSQSLPIFHLPSDISFTEGWLRPWPCVPRARAAAWRDHWPGCTSPMKLALAVTVFFRVKNTLLDTIPECQWSYAKQNFEWILV